MLCVSRLLNLHDTALIWRLVLRSLTKNPDGMFWAGDTAQTISVGSSFRFNDLKAFLFRLEVRRVLEGILRVINYPSPRKDEKIHFLKLVLRSCKNHLAHST